MIIHNQGGLCTHVLVVKDRTKIFLLNEMGEGGLLMNFIVYFKRLIYQAFCAVLHVDFF